MPYARVAVRARMSVIAVVAVFTAMLVGVDNAAACSCVPLPVKKLLKQADGGFNGRLLSVDPAEGTTEAAFRYRVGVVAKGPFRRGQVVTVWSQNSDSVCGLTQGIGDLYGLFVAREDRRWVSGACGLVSPRKMRGAADSAGSSSASAPGGACPG
jgi:hypothetical protein